MISTLAHGERDSSESPTRNIVELGNSGVQVAYDCHSRVAPVDSDDAATGVSACAAQVDARHWSSWGESVAPHVGRKTFALEDMPTGETNLLLNVRWTEDLGIDNGIWQITAEAANGLQRQGPYFPAMYVPTA